MINIPSLSDLRNNAQQQFDRQLGASSSLVQRLYVRAASIVMAGVAHLLYLRLAKTQENIFPDTAEPATQGGSLDRFGLAFLGRSRRQAQSGEYSVTVTGTVGATISSIIQWRSDDNSNNPGNLFMLDSPVTLTSATQQITLRALTPGSDASLNVNDTLTAVQPILNVNNFATVVSEVTAPIDEETVEQYRVATIASIRLESQGGSASDFRLWASDASGVVNSYPYNSSTQNNVVDLYVEANTATGAASQGVLNEVRAVVEQDPDTTRPLPERGRRPLGIFNVNVVSVNVLDVDVTVIGLLPDTASNRATCEASIRQYLSTVRPFIAGADIAANRNDNLSVGRMSVAIQQDLPSGALFNQLNVFVNSNQVFSMFQFTNGNIPTLNSTSFL